MAIFPGERAPDPTRVLSGAAFVLAGARAKNSMTPGTKKPPTPQRIVISINTAWNIANFRAGLVRALLDRGCEVITIAPPDAYVQQLVDMGCRFIPLEMDNKGSNPVADVALFFRYLALLRRERPDFFLGYTIKPNIYGSLAAQLCGVPVVNNVSGLGTAFIRDSWVTKVVKMLYRAALARSHVVFFQNAEDRDLFLRLRLVDAGKTALLPGSGVDIERFKPAGPDQGPSEDGVRFLLIARLLYDKGVGEYVEAARILKARIPSTTCSILGFLDADNRTAVSREDVDRWVSEGVIEYLGSADDVRPHIAQADCIVLPSYREGAPRTLLEAAAMAKPVITTDVPGCRDVMDHGRTGFLCKPKDPGDLVLKMMEFIDMSMIRRRTMGEAGRKKMEREFDERIVIGKYLAILSLVVNARN